MKSDLDDPNNHVPEISPNDDWDDLDEVSEKSRMGLPPRRQDRGLPPKKVAKGPTVNLHEAQLRIGQDAPTDDDGVSEETGVGTATAPQGDKKQRKRPAKKTAKKAANPKKKAAAKKTKGKASSESKTSGSGDVSRIVAESTQEGDERIPQKFQPARAKRLNHQIGTGDTKPGIGLSQKPPVPTTEKISGGKDEKVARLRRRFMRGERADWGEGKGGDSYKWIAYTGVGVVLLVVLAVFLSQLSGGKSGRKTKKSFYSQLAPAERQEKEGTDDLEMLEMLTSSQEEAKMMYATYVTADSPSEISDLLYNKDLIVPLVEKSWKPGGAPKGWTPGEDTLWTVLDKDGERFGVLEGMNSDFTKFSAYFRKEGEDLKLDWKATTGYGSSTFEMLKSGNGDGSEIRTWISRSDFYTFSLPEESYRSFRLMSPSGDSNLWAYTEIGSDLDSELVKLFVPSEITGEVQNEIQVQLSMEPGPEEALPNQWLIRDLLRLSWLDSMGEQKADE